MKETKNTPTVSLLHRIRIQLLLCFSVEEDYIIWKESLLKHEIWHQLITSHFTSLESLSARGASTYQDLRLVEL